jgi:hypothetical protein
MYLDSAVQGRDTTVRDTAFKGRIVQEMHCPRDASAKGRIVLGMHRSNVFYCTKSGSPLHLSISMYWKT